MLVDPRADSDKTLLRQSHAIRSKRRIGQFYLIPGLQIDSGHQDVILRMADQNEPFWVALSPLYCCSMKDNYFGLNLPIPDLWSDDYPNLYQHWSANFQGGLDFVNPPGVWGPKVIRFGRCFRTDASIRSTAQFCGSR